MKHAFDTGSSFVPHQFGEVGFVKYLICILVTSVCLIGCGGGGKSSGNGGDCCSVPGINVAVVSPVGAAAIDDNANLTLAITVQVTNDPSNAGVTWTLTPAVLGNPAGTLSFQQPLSVTFTPPMGVTSPVRVTVTATSVSDAKRSAEIPITVYPPLVAMTTSPDLSTAFLNTNYTCIQQPINLGGVTEIPCAVNMAGGVGPYTWSLGNSALPQGLQLGLTGNISGTDQYYVQIIGAPTATGIYPFTLTATDATGNAIMQSLNINVAPAQLKVVTPTVLTVIKGAPYGPIELQASGGVPPYTWSLATGSPAPPSWLSSGMGVSPGGAIFGTAPSGFSAPYSFALQVADSQTPVPAQAVFPPPATSNGSIITIAYPSDQPAPETECGSGPSVQTGIPYAFVFTGFDPDGPVTFSGSFTADASGDLTGEEDIVRSRGAQLGQPLTAGSSISFASTFRGCLTLNTSGSSTQFSLAPTAQAQIGEGYFTEGRIIEFDDTNGTGTRGSGYFRIQDSTIFATPVTGPFAFRFSGWNAQAGHFAMAGTATAKNGLFPSVFADVNDGGIFYGGLAGGSGTIAGADSNGRGTATLSIGASTYDLIYYIVDANDLIFSSAQVLSNGNPLITGEATASGGPFSQATLSNSHIYRFGGDVPGSPDVGVGLLHFDGSGGASGTNYERNAGTTAATSLSAQYEVDPTSGRFSFSGTGAPVVGYAVPSGGEVSGYLVGTGASAASGTMEFQTNNYPPGYQFGPVSGTYGIGTEEMFDPPSTVSAGVANTGLSGSIAESYDNYMDSSSLTGLFPIQEFALFKYTWNSDGSGTWGGNSYMVANQKRFFSIDTSPLNAHPAVVVAQCWSSCAQ